MSTHLCNQKYKIFHLNLTAVEIAKRTYVPLTRIKHRLKIKMLCFYSNFRFTAKLREWYSRSSDYAVHLTSFCYNINEKVKKNILCPGHCLCGVCSLPASVWAFLWGLHFPPASQRWAGRQTGVSKLSQSWWIGCDAL